jgi:gamma-glutamyl-gamma-aminobutyrate hydrolase PuuD
MIAVQFHPERLGKDNPIYQKMRDSFYKAMGE